eukprot:TRINITY_DN199_c0_g3_i3.p3 TRINITY_DN199_c0_g3~~TRINITY_DN199_c0_g3_i3.p3  ORF type:complete len:225 (-),score=37.63 TRINITY_DN199_c0_g3_i3:193-867(-)
MNCFRQKLTNRKGGGATAISGALDGESEPSFEGVAVSDYVYALFDGFYSVENGKELIVQSLQTDFQDFFDFIVDFLELVDYKQDGCFDDADNTYIAIWVALILNILQEPLLDEIASIANQTLVFLAYRYNEKDRIVGVLEPLVAAMDSAQGSGILSVLMSTGVDVLSDPLATVMQDMRYGPESENMAGILSMFFVSLQEGLGLELDTLLDFLGEFFRNVLAALK